MSINPYEPPSEQGNYQPERIESKESPGAIAYGVVVRSLGLITILYGFWYFSVLVYHALGIPEVNSGDYASSFISGTMLVVGGLLLVGFAKAVVAASYPR